MFKSANVGVAWAHRTLKHIKTLKNIKIVKQHASKPLFEAQSPWFLLFNDKKIEKKRIHLLFS